MGGRLGRKFHPLYMNSTNLVKPVLRDAFDDSFINSGTYKMTLTDEDNSNVSGAVDISLEAVGSDGVWKGFIPHSITLTENDIYILTLTFTGTDGHVLKDVRWYKACKYPKNEYDINLQ